MLTVSAAEILKQPIFPLVKQFITKSSVVIVQFFLLEKYSDLTYKVRNKATGFQKVVHVDGMKRKYKRGDSFQESNREKVGTQETDKSSNIDQKVVDEIEEVYYDAEEYVEVTEELGRGKRQKHPPQRFTDYVL